VSDLLRYDDGVRVSAAICIASFLLAAGARGDQVEMQNGDRYVGKVITMSADSVVLQSDVLGRIKLPRAKVANINVGTAVTPLLGPPAPVATNQVKAASVVSTNKSTDFDTALKQLSANTNAIEKVRKQFLSDAGPEANNKFDELVSGLATGKIDIASIRAQAKSAADQLRSLRQQGGDAGGDVGELLDSYLSILDSFVKETANTPGAATSKTNATTTPLSADKD
jgi:hypothetical protein